MINVGDTLVNDNEYLNQGFVVIKGQVNCYIKRSRNSLNKLKPSVIISGESFAMTSLINGYLSPVKYTSSTFGKILIITKTALDTALQKFPLSQKVKFFSFTFFI